MQKYLVSLYQHILARIRGCDSLDRDNDSVLHCLGVGENHRPLSKDVDFQWPLLSSSSCAEDLFNNWPRSALIPCKKRKCILVVG